jgi:hypothetical protein
MKANLGMKIFDKLCRVIDEIIAKKTMVQL